MPEQHKRSDGEEIRTVDAEQHGEALAAGSRQSPQGEIKTQRGDPAELPADVVARGREPTDISVRGVSFAILGLLGGVILSVVLAFAYLFWLGDHERSPAISALATRKIIPSAPRLQIDPLPERLALEEAARARLRGYARLALEPDRARIPIERAMQLLAEHGWPDSDEPPASRRVPGSPLPGDAGRVSPRSETNNKRADQAPAAPLGAPP
jgi:hypothetical protein